MTTIQRWLFCLVGCAVLIAGGWFAVLHYGTGRYQAGYSAAVAAGKAQHDRDAAAAHQTESDLRAELRAKDAEALRKEQDYAASLEAAQRRVLTGADRLRCPTSPVPAPPAPVDRPAASGPAIDPGGPDLVPQAAADVLGYGAAIASLVSRYERIEQRFEDCRAVNSK